MTYATVSGTGNLPKVVLVARDGARAEIYLHGAHLTSWTPAGAEDDRLFLSARSHFAENVAIRGGIPVCFPQFSAQGPLPNHGFARVTPWHLASAGLATDGSACAVLRLADSAATRQLWPRAFALELAVTLSGPWLDIRLSVRNAGTERFDFTAALHTYLRVADAAATTVHGLDGARFHDKVRGQRDCLQRASELRIDGEVDRIYCAAPGDLEVRESARALGVEATGFPDTVVWNPGTAAASLADLEPGGEKRMLCIEAAAAANPVALDAGGTWRGSQRLTAR
jgi:glucose-6-phosphate 1-epimerase